MLQRALPALVAAQAGGETLSIPGTAAPVPATTKLRRCAPEGVAHNAHMMTCGHIPTGPGPGPGARRTGVASRRLEFRMQRRSILNATVAAGAAVLASTTAAAPAAAAAAGRWSPKRPLRVQMVLFDGVAEQDFIGPNEAFTIAGFASSGAVAVSYVSVTGPRTIRAVGGTKIVVENGWSPRDADLLLVPGGGPTGPEEPGVAYEIAKGHLPRSIAAAARDRLVISSVCNGALILAAAGLTRGRPCNTHQTARAQLAQSGAVLKDARVVDDGDLITCAGATSGIDLALHVLDREFGPDFAVMIAGVLEFEARGTVWTARGR
ncbi:putative intracellular protease/amidase [Catenuloplanes nepalensis]|uniref:Intracellular protease/amidase n=1 Tax=Catenuloplanes nepalensis TaxID=587533 RepID=A0ABT9MSH8_9ACTN|nr:DJ-1/PfpI family protein [Catenuloplanes nepalensis]MDP9793986.1 putative intracellular protease/amidase [Catenuloplanes nepalensis]